ncbi:Nucleolar protein 9 [Neophaeococcomyces mojaviensis]|uniref:Nucleolar protein 9 n=1 Tax=Neophaeococcomyces mojaviensis TaxID=3383035 RepID=A0ACC3A7K2_9EURO|nr:Nucleolar protein 9 [Knufia sp. JES_112]
MPKELKKRGRRFEKQQQKLEGLEGPPPKRRRISETHEAVNFDVTGDAGDDFISFGHQQDDHEEGVQATTFYGLLTEDEQEYYANVNNKISANDFESDEDRDLFIDAVYRESAGKEIKLASSQSCSRYLERVIRLSTPSQLKSLFQAFLQDLDYLIQHRFGSHCCETLFLQAARHVNLRPEGTSEEESTLESLFLQAAEKMEANIGFLLTERFASHTIRVLLLVLSGQPLDDESARDVVASRKKERIELSQQSEPTSSENRKVPGSFKKARKDLGRSAVSTLDTTYLRALATHPTGNPVLQLLLRLELSDDDDSNGSNDRVVLRKLIPEGDFDPESDSGKFVSGLVYDSAGAHLVQTLVKFLPGKAFKKMYRNLLRERIGKLAKNEIASYVAVSIFERVGKDDLSHARDAVIPELPGLVERNRLAVIRSLIERCSSRGVDLMPFEKPLKELYGGDSSSVLNQMLKLQPSNTDADMEGQDGEKGIGSAKSTVDLQGSLLAQTILRTEQLSGIIQQSLLAQSNDTMRRLAKNTVSSRVIQVALTTDVSPTSFRRQLVPKFYSMVAELAVDSSGSHVVDALWSATDGSHFMKERIAKLLQENEQQLRDSMHGRTVWRNWNMDNYQRRSAEWHAAAKGIKHKEAEGQENAPTKSAIQLARERHMQKQAKKAQHGQLAAHTVATHA